MSSTAALAPNSGRTRLPNRSRNWTTTRLAGAPARSSSLPRLPPTLGTAQLTLSLCAHRTTTRSSSPSRPCSSPSARLSNSSKQLLSPLKVVNDQAQQPAPRLLPPTLPSPPPRCPTTPSSLRPPRSLYPNPLGRLHLASLPSPPTWAALRLSLRRNRLCRTRLHLLRTFGSSSSSSSRVA